MRLGLAGTVTRLSIDSPLTPLILLASFLIGIIALVALPREEEPQISVPMVDIHVAADGLRAEDAVELVTKPLEDIVKGIDGVEHVYSRTRDDTVVVTARFFVGTDADNAILRIHEKIRRNYDRIPVGIPEPLVVGLGIDDVAALVLTLAPKPGAGPRWNDRALRDIASELQHELAKVEDVGFTYIVGGRPHQLRIEPDPERLSLYGVTLNQLVEKIRNANRSFRVGALREANRQMPTVAGQTLQGISDIGRLVLTTRDGRPVYVNDVTRIRVAGRPDEHRAWTIAASADGTVDARPAVSVAFAKRKGSNAIRVAERILERLEVVRGGLVPDAVEVAVTRNYGETARQKSNELLSHLVGATITIVLIVVVFVGWREGLAVLVVVPATILLTFAWAWLMGYTINRVSLFALIFAIGILVDDAIVVVDNVTRHWAMRDGRGRTQAAIDGVAEIGNPTIIATLTIIAALLPMAFVGGLMGPYMEPIPVNASAAVAISFFLAITVTPWLMCRLERVHDRAGEPPPGGDEAEGGLLGRLYRPMARPLLRGRRRSAVFLVAVALVTVASFVLFLTRGVTVKLLPFDDKPELQIVVDLPEGASLEATERVLMAAARRLVDIPELVSIQAYAGTAAPFSFNGLVRHYYLRRSPELGDPQVNLLPKDGRGRQSHEIALDARRRLAGLPAPPGSRIKVVEAPPGPPVIATLLAEIYGPDAESRRAAARRVSRAFEAVDFVVDVDESFGVRPQRVRFSIDQESLEFHGVEQQAVYDTLSALLNGVTVGYSHRGAGADPIEIAVRLPRSSLFLSERLLATPVPGAKGEVELGDVVRVGREPASYPIFRRNGRYAEMVSGELAGRYEAPIYGMIEVTDRLANGEATGAARPIPVRLHGQPEDESAVSLLWDGEWEITYVTFRDMGLAFAAALVAIYILVVGLFRNFLIPLVILVPVPLTLIGIVLGHWMFAAPFTATSMIGFIALAGIIVRNSILLVDFVRGRLAAGEALRHALIEAGAVRFRPIFLTAVTAQIGAAFILFDPIFQGLAISLVFGLASSTFLTVLVIPAIYVCFRDDGQPGDTGEVMGTVVGRA